MSEQSFSELAIRLREFAAERDWDQFHSPKNLVMALSADKLGIDLAEAAFEKIEVNRIKYLADKMRGSAKKYTDL